MSEEKYSINFNPKGPAWMALTGIKDPAKCLLLNKNTMKQEQYFIPAFEDIHVGYEWEFQYNRNSPHQKEIIGQDAFEQLSQDIINQKVRVSYLTKEQLEAEGWKRWMSTTLVKESARAELTLLAENRILISQHGAVSFCGECKDINTFRYLCKLLKIK